jgi:hypothetical protein
MGIIKIYINTVRFWVNYFDLTYQNIGIEYFIDVYCYN